MNISNKNYNSRTQITSANIDDINFNSISASGIEKQDIMSRSSNIWKNTSDEWFPAINAVDINWNGAEVEENVVLNSTPDLLNWIKTKSSSNATSIPGTTGAIGPQGVRGPQGAKGSQGARGGTGVSGQQGARGLIGANGMQGARGVQAMRGMQGSRGGTGTSGPQGSKGSNGPSGTSGPQGSRGLNGVNGPQGSKGMNGANGSQGAKGPQGAPGSFDSELFNSLVYRVVQLETYIEKLAKYNRWPSLNDIDEYLNILNYDYDQDGVFSITDRYLIPYICSFASTLANDPNYDAENLTYNGLLLDLNNDGILDVVDVAHIEGIIQDLKVSPIVDESALMPSGDEYTAITQKIKRYTAAFGTYPTLEQLTNWEEPTD